jgi:D-amino-acid dehydrogenase
MTPDGPPLIGATPVQNLLLNTGHGHVGWTMACGSAKLLTALVSGRGAELDPRPYALDRFRRGGFRR